MQARIELGSRTRAEKVHRGLTVERAPEVQTATGLPMRGEAQRTKEAELTLTST